MKIAGLANIHAKTRFLRAPIASHYIVYPVWQEVQRLMNRQISWFSGREFNVDPSCDLNGCVDFLISKSPEQLTVEAPAIVLVEAKKADLNEGIGQCLAEMVAAQRFKEAAQNPIATIYGCISSGTQWRFLERQGRSTSPIIPCFLWKQF